MNQIQQSPNQFLLEYIVDSVVLCGNANNPDSIEYLGNRKFGWRLSKESVISRIQNGLGTFYVNDVMMGKRIPIQVLKDKNGSIILSAYANARPWDTLLGLPSCIDLPLID